MTSQEPKPITVIGHYPNGKILVVHCFVRRLSHARGQAVRKIAFDVYGERCPGLTEMNEAIAAVVKDFHLDMVVDGHVRPMGRKSKQVIFHD